MKVCIGVVTRTSHFSSTKVMPITDSGVVTIGTSSPLAGIYQSVAGQTNPTGYPLNELRQGTGKYWRASDNSPSPGVARQLGLLRDTKYRCLQGQSQGTYTLSTSQGEHVNLQGSIYGTDGGGGAAGSSASVSQGNPQPGFPGQAGGTGIIVQGTNNYLLVTGDVWGGSGGGGGAGGFTIQPPGFGPFYQARPGGAGGNGGTGISAAPSGGQITVYVRPAAQGARLSGGSGGGGASGGVYGTSQTNLAAAGGNGGGGGRIGPPTSTRGGLGGQGGNFGPNQGVSGNPGFPGVLPLYPNEATQGGAYYPYVLGFIQAAVSSGGRGGGWATGQGTAAAGAQGSTSTITSSAPNGVGTPGAGGAVGSSTDAGVTVVSNSQGVVV